MEWWGWGDGVLGLGRWFVGTREMVVGAGEVVCSDREVVW